MYPTFLTFVAYFFFSSLIFCCKRTGYRFKVNILLLFMCIRLDTLIFCCKRTGYRFKVNILLFMLLDWILLAVCRTADVAAVVVVDITRTKESCGCCCRYEHVLMLGNGTCIK